MHFLTQWEIYKISPIRLREPFYLHLSCTTCHTVAEALPGLKKSSSYATGTDWKDNPLALKKCQEQNPTPRALREINKFVCLCIYSLVHLRGKFTK